MPRIPHLGSSRRGGHARTAPAPDTGPSLALDRSSPPSAASAIATQDMDGRWSPIVVDIPIYDFESRPARCRDYVPDTIFDGWSSDHFTVRVASVRGYAHRYHGTPRQDHAEAAIHEQSGACIFAVADGVSSASHSHTGAAAACHTAVDVIRWQLDNGHSIIDWNQVVGVTARELMRTAARVMRQRDPEPSAAEALIATTLTAGCVMPAPDGAAGAMVQIGDSGAWILHEDTYCPLLAQKHDDPSGVVSSAVSPLPRVPSPITPVAYRLMPGSVLLIGTDGFGDPLGSGEGQVGDLFAKHLRVPPPARGLAHVLDFSRETFDDDRSLVAIWALPPETQP